MYRRKEGSDNTNIQLVTKVFPHSNNFSTFQKEPKHIGRSKIKY